MSRPVPVALDAARDAARALGALAAQRTAAERLRPEVALGRRVAEEVVAGEALPRFDASAMDGFAIRSADVAAAAEDAPVALTVEDEARAGRAAESPVAAGTAARISTGAPLPPGADAVVRIEDTTDEGARVVVRRPVVAGADVRRTGEDVAPGDVVLVPGDLLHPGSIGLLSGLGVRDVAVARPPAVVVLVTGDEVAAGEGPLGDAMVRDVNGVAIPAVLAAAGARSVRTVRVGDDHDAMVAALRAAVVEAEIVVTCGGLSVGRHDHVRRALHEVGAEERVPAVGMKPGGPAWLGALDGPDGPRAVVGLPGNPAAAMVAAILFGAAAVRAATGTRPLVRHARLGAATARDVRRHRVLWATTVPGEDGVLRVAPAALQHSHRLRPAAASDVLAVIPPGPEPLPDGALVEVVGIPGAARGGATAPTGRRGQIASISCGSVLSQAGGRLPGQ
jgi:molybdopterin molybdotransferase